ncbi:hypothetical protein V6N13_080429 [Hibiscus sabdariffa]
MSASLRNLKGANFKARDPTSTESLEKRIAELEGDLISGGRHDEAGLGSILAFKEDICFECGLNKSGVNMR